MFIESQSVSYGQAMREHGVQISKKGGVSPWVANGQGVCSSLARFRRYDAILGCVLGMGACVSQAPVCMEVSV